MSGHNSPIRVLTLTCLLIAAFDSHIGGPADAAREVGKIEGRGGDQYRAIRPDSRVAHGGGLGPAWL